MDDVEEGVLSAWLEQQGYGWIRRHGAEEDAFVHRTALPRGTSTPQVGMRVAFKVMETAKGPRAVDVQVLP